MATRFDDFIEVILRNEGGYVNDPDDRGGETRYGIAKKFYPDLDIANLTIDEAKEIYYKDYYKPCSLHYFSNDRLALHVFDMAVNAGRHNAIKLLQEVLRDCPVDGEMGPVTGLALSNAQMYVDIVEVYKAQRIKYYYRVSKRGKNAKFLDGWVNRVNKT